MLDGGVAVQDGGRLKHQAGQRLLLRHPLQQRGVELVLRPAQEDARRRAALQQQQQANGHPRPVARRRPEPEARKALLEQLKLAPPPAYATTQALYTDFCKVPEHGEKPTCVRIKANQASTNMRNWYCASPAGSAGDWCKRQEILARMQKIPMISTPTTDADKVSFARARPWPL